MKKNYQKPDMMMVRIQHQSHILSGSSTVTTVNSGDTGLGYDGGSNQAARTKVNTVDWDDWSE